MSEQSATAVEVIIKIKKAADLLKEKGEKALDILRNPTSEFTWKDTYIFIIDVEKSVVLSNPAFPEREGGNIRKHLDWDNKKYGIKLCETANQGGGWMTFVWPKAFTDEPTRKLAYIYPIPGYRYSVCAGIYDDKLTLEDANKQWFIKEE